MATCLIAVGSNLGDRLALLGESIARLEQHPQIQGLERSSWFHTRPIGGPAGQDEFVNAAVRAETTLRPRELLAVLHEIELQLGRQRVVRWEARRVDLDLLLYDDLICHTPELTLPHPRMTWRRFVLEPAAQVASELRHPVLGWTLRQLLEHLNSAPEYIAVTGVPGAGKTALTRRLAETLGLRWITGPACTATASNADEFSLVHSRVAELNGPRWPIQGPGAISDFWLGQSLAYVRCCVEPELPADFETAWRVCQAQVVTPKLLVLLELPPAGLDDHRQRLQDELRRLVIHGQFAPALSLNAAAPAPAFSELAAAVEAMR